MVKKLFIIPLVLAVFCGALIYFMPEAFGYVRPSGVTPAELNNLLIQKRVKVVDTRKYLDFSMGSIGGSLNLPAMYLENRINELAPYSNILLITSNDKEEEAVIKSIRKAFPKKVIILLNGGMNAWMESGFHMENDLPHGC